VADVAQIDMALVARRPLSNRWVQRRAPMGTFWQHPSGVRVCSSLDVADLPDGSGEVGPQWHISISQRSNRRPTDGVVAFALKAFDLVGAEEDNHHPGVARHFFLVCDPQRRVDCECKTTETVETDADGYRWTNPTDETEGRGCEFEVLAQQLALKPRPCPIHSRTSSAEPGR